MRRQTSTRTAEVEIPTRPPFVAYGLGDSFAGPRILERWSRRGTVAKEIALGHGHRWSDQPWLEVATVNPVLVPEFYPQQMWDRRVRSRLESEREELTGRRLWHRTSGSGTEDADAVRVKVSTGELLEFPLQHLGPLSCGAAASTEGALIVITWLGPWSTQGLDLKRVETLEPYVLGLEQDRHRRLGSGDPEAD